jgi:hypothetical protein
MISTGFRAMSPATPMHAPLAMPQACVQVATGRVSVRSFRLPSRAGEKMCILACEVYTATYASIGFPPLDVVCI